MASDLDKAAILTNQAILHSGFAALAASRGISMNDMGAVRESFRLIRQAKTASEAALNRLLVLGASRPGRVVAADTLPLHLLDTPANRRYLAALEAAAEAGAAVDRERGWVDEDGEPTGHGETLAGLALLCRREIFGPDGKD